MEITSESRPYVAIGKVCDEAKNIINGARKDEYGGPIESFSRIADYWNMHLAHTKHIYAKLTYKDVAMLLVLFKIAREENKHKHDNLTDIIGYTALLDYMYEIEEFDRTTKIEKIEKMVEGYNKSNGLGEIFEKDGE